MSDDDPNPRANSGMTGANRDLRTTMRSMLRAQGIELDPPVVARASVTPEVNQDAVARGTAILRAQADAAHAARIAELAPDPESVVIEEWGNASPVQPPQRGWPKVNR